MFWNVYGKELTFQCPAGHILELPGRLDEQTFNQTDFNVRCDADARWRPVLNHSKYPDVPIIPACIRKFSKVIIDCFDT